MNTGLALWGSIIPNDDLSLQINPFTGLPQKSSKPVVSFGKTDMMGVGHRGQGIFYGWYHQHGNPAIPGLSAANNDAYIGLYVNGHIPNLSTFWWPMNSYAIIPIHPNNTPTGTPSIAFSGNNDPVVDALYMAFSQIDTAWVPGGYNIAYKSIPWTALSYGPMGEEESQTAVVLSAYPNPFSSSITIKPAESMQSDEVYQLYVSDITGRKIYEQKGTINELNQHLQTAPTHWQTGQYILQLRDIQSGKAYSVPLIGTKE
jgi:hypothetical protein